ncbi:MFS transporter [Legionella longbeachae]|uniref:Major facilitator superfamily (MFS) profile domain-containing protein n=1 Tax=Legionella longbeachae serogroup 1 (strain NSW150) TaxID=661367 RepID=D3HRZ6_LEGLN|nr:MFS transporter [Legionella longbeachae]VEE02177.1 2-acylglycerophosphoethanolamine acyltransferase [Legionella oakridgensis]HBD7396581.1 MFS transporter [Legionella pneumophila]ARB91521.1 MFS transporter [Legionella longbeachae]EEZ95196.1 putative lysophospholipid transporter lplT [Legionella longbeachae D-4968]QIN32058.1 MFS transporter [Legionella longbeachae]
MGNGAFYLLKERKFLPFFLTQFFGAFNDNAFKLAMLTLISYHLTHNQAQSEFYQAIAGALFIIPFFLLSATSGQLADKYDKALITRIIKILELFLMIIGSLALCWGNIFLMMATLTGLGVHSTFFGPIKYAILPDHLPKKELLGATGLIDASTFIAILMGTTIGTLSIGIHSPKPYVAVFLTIFVALAGLTSSLFIPKAPSKSVNIKVDKQVWRVTYKMLKQATENTGILVAILILSWFWLLGTVILTKLPDYTNYVLGANNTVFAIFLALFSIGIASGSLAVNLIFQGQIYLLIVPWAMLAFTCFTMDLYWATPYLNQSKNAFSLINFFTHFAHWRIAFDLFMLAFSAGLFIVPLYTYLQVKSPSESRAQVIATNNIYNSLFMVAGALIVIVLLHFSAAIPQIFLILSLLNALAALLARIFLKKVVLTINHEISESGQ